MRRWGWALLLAGLVGAPPGRPAHAEDPPGRVLALGEDDLGLAGAVLVAADVALEEMPLLGAGAPVLATGDAAGVIRLPPRGPAATGRWLVVAPGHAPVLVPAGPGPHLLRLPPARPSRGRLRAADPEGAPPAGLIVATPLPGEGEVAHASPIDADGGWELPNLHAGRYRLWLRQGGGRWRPLGTLAAGDQRWRPPEAVGGLAGELIEDTGGRSPPAGRVGLALTRLPPDGTEVRAHSDAKGRFHFPDLRPGVWELTIADPAWEPVEGAPLRYAVEAGADTEGLSVLLRRRRFVTGRVEDADGRPVAGAQVRLLGVVREPPLAVPPPGESDAAGHFRLGPASPADGYRLAVLSAAGGTFLSHPFAVVETADTALLPVRLRPAWRLELKVRDADGRAVPGAWAEADDATRALDAAHSLARRAGGDAEGRLVLDGLPPEDVRVRVGAPGFQPEEIEVPRPGTGALRRETVHLAPGLAVEGRILPGEGGVAPPYGLVLESPAGAEPRRLESDAAGAFAFGGLAPGPYDLVVWPRATPAGAGAWLARFENLAAGQAPVELTLPARGRLRVRLTGLLADGPAAEVVVLGRERGPGEAAARGAERWRELLRASVPAEGLGEVLLAGLAPGSYVVRARQGAREAPREPVALGAGEEAALEVLLPAAARVAGVFADERGRGLLGVAVRLVPEDARDETRPPAHETVSDARGDFSFDAVGAGRWLLEARAPGRAPLTRRLDLREGEVLLLDDLALGAGATLTGHVRDAAGRSLDGAPLSLWPLDGGTPWRTLTDGGGTYRFEGLPAGTYELAVEGGPGVAQRAWLDLGAEETRELDLGPAGEGRIGLEIHRRGRPVVGAAVHARREATAQDAVEREAFGHTDLRGECVLTGLAAGAWWVRVVSGSAALEQRVVLAEGAEAAFEWELHEGILRGEVRTLDGAAVPGARVEAHPVGEPGGLWRIRGRADAAGRFELTGLPVGRYDLKAYAEGFPPGRLAGAEADLEGAVFRVEILVGRGGDVRLVVRDGDQRPVVGARVWAEGPAGEPLLAAPVRTSGGGRAQVSGLPEGRVFLRVVAEGYGRPARVAVDVIEGDVAEVEVTLRRPGTLEVLVDAWRWDPVRRVRLDVLRLPDRECVARRLPLARLEPEGPWEPLPLAGSVRVEDLEPGRYEVVVDGGPRFEPLRAEVEVRAGERTQVRLGLEER